MRFFKGIKDNYKKSEAAVIAQNLLTIFVRNHMFDGDPAAIANNLVSNIWDEIPQLLDGQSGSRPHKFTVAATAFAHAIRMNDAALPTSASHIYALCIGKILSELEERRENYPLSGLDHTLLERSSEIFVKFSEAQSSTPLAQEMSALIDGGRGRQTHENTRNPSDGLKFFQSIHRIDDAYLSDILGQETPKGEIHAEIQKMCNIVEAAISPLQVMALLSGGTGDPKNEETIGYLFGWLDVFKTNIWRVSDFNRSFFHYGFMLWFGGNNVNQSSRMQSAIDAMTCLGLNTQNPHSIWLSSAQRGTNEARAFLRDSTPPRGPHGG